MDGTSHLATVKKKSDRFFRQERSSKCGIKEWKHIIENSNSAVSCCLHSLEILPSSRRLHISMGFQRNLQSPCHKTLKEILFWL
jgi:hypothetical protein